MTIIARLNTLHDAYAGLEALRSKSIPPDLAKHGEHLIISVDDDFAENAKTILANDGRFRTEHLCCDSSLSWLSPDDHNA